MEAYRCQRYVVLLTAKTIHCPWKPFTPLINYHHPDRPLIRASTKEITCKLAPIHLNPGLTDEEDKIDMSWSPAW